MSFSRSRPEVLGVAASIGTFVATRNAELAYIVGQKLISAFQPGIDGDRSFQPINSSEFISIMRMNVEKAELWKRPLEQAASFLEMFGAVHQGVVVTLDNGAKYLIHKFAADDAGLCFMSGNAEEGPDKKIEVNDNKGKATVAVVEAKAMGSKWSFVEEKMIWHSTVDDFVQVCGQEYRLFSDNCMTAASKMMNLP